MTQLDVSPARGAGAYEAKTATLRYERLDALRAVAIVWMAAFHFGFDLDHFGIWKQDFHRDPFWTLQRTAIVTLFLFCAGLSQSVAQAHGQTAQRFWRRWLQIAGCAVLVTIGSWWMFPKSYITFGVLHGIAAMLILLRLVSGVSSRWLWAIGAVALVLPHVVRHAFFDTRWTNWVGLVTRKPATEDYVPLLPWFGVMCFGLAAGRWVLARKPRWLSGGLPRALQPLALLGRWSLTFYMLHQPVLIGLIMAALALRR